MKYGKNVAIMNMLFSREHLAHPPCIPNAALINFHPFG
jgi:hypothetical protein